MSLDIGIIGLPQSGRTTLFNALTRGESTEGQTRKGASAHIGTARVPEPRLDVLADIFHPQKVVRASATYIDIGASVKGLVSDEKGIGGQLLTQLGRVNVLINVVRAFSDDSIPHIEGNLDVDRDIANMNMELVFSDMALLERRLTRIKESLKGAKPAERPGLLREQEVILKVKDNLEKDILVREQALTPEEAGAIVNFQLLTAKPLLIVVNIGEDQLAETASLETELNSRYARPNCHCLSICGKLEMELAQLDDNAAGELRAEYHLAEPSSDRIIKLSYQLGGLISFFTVGPDEVRAWSIPVGSTAVKAAGKIHSDLERGFIRAEVISYDDMVRCGSLAEARKKGLLRLEGKNYTVQDTDILTILFNV